jgi:PAS domain-containing protein
MARCLGSRQAAAEKQLVIDNPKPFVGRVRHSRTGRALMNERPPGAVFTDPERSVTEPKGDARDGMTLHESAKQLRAVLDTAVDGIILIDALGNIRMFNRSLREAVRLSAG